MEEARPRDVNQAHGIGECQCTHSFFNPLAKLKGAFHSLQRPSKVQSGGPDEWVLMSELRGVWRTKELACNLDFL